MANRTAKLPKAGASLRDLLRRLGNISPDRVRLDPPPGQATKHDVTRIQITEDRLYELVRGTLVEKTMGAKESFIALRLAIALDEVNRELGDIGMLLGADGTLELWPGLVRIPDVSMTNWDRIPARKVPDEPIPALAPDLAVEVLSPSNTKREMAIKLREYFRAGVRLVWYIDPATRSVRVYTSVDGNVELTEADSLDGGDVLPGFRVPVIRLFEKLNPTKS